MVRLRLRGSQHAGHQDSLSVQDTCICRMTMRKGILEQAMLIIRMLFSPFFTTIFGIVKQIVSFKTVHHHPVLIVTSPDTIQFIDQVREPTLPMASFGSPNIFCDRRREWPGPGHGAWEMDRPREGVVRIFTILQASGGTGVMFVTAFLRRTIDLEVIWLV